MKRLATAVWLTTMWVLLWGDLSAANVLGGLAAAATLLLIFPARRRTPESWLRPIPALWFLAFFLYKLVEANVVLAWEIITPRNRIREGIVELPVTACSPGLVTLIANAISLTPGTLTVEVDREGGHLFIHVLHLRDVEAVRHDLLRFEQLALRAFGSPEAIAVLDAHEELR